MKRVVSALLILSIGFVVYAGPGRPHDGMNDVDAEIEAILGEYDDIALGEFTIGDLQDLAGELSIPLQEQAYVRKATIASMMVPGMGQFITGDAVSGSLYLAADIAVVTGTLVGLYFLLPPELQFDQLDYFNTPASDIKAAWQAAKDNMTFTSALPLMGVAAGSMLIQHGLRFFSSRQASEQARSNIEDGTVTFEPRPMIVTDRFGRIGMGMGFRY